MIKKLAIVSVYDKAGVEDFAQGLVDLGFEILSTGGTAKYLQGKGIPVTSVSKYTGAPEICEGRVKTLHPKIHGGILARREVAEDMAELIQEGIGPIDVVAVNLYPFSEMVAKAHNGEVKPDESLVEYIDIGGPTMIRAAAKNCKYVLPVCDPLDYQRVLEGLKSDSVDIAVRRELAAKVFSMMSAYDAEVARYFAADEQVILPEVTGGPLQGYELGLATRVESLRYGENPHQKAGLYRLLNNTNKASAWKQLAGKELSYNNLLDTQAAVDLAIDVYKELTGTPSCVIIKHTNPCGVAIGTNQLDAFRRARDCDPVSAFGGIVALTSEVDAVLAECILEGFVEVVCAPRFTEEALLVFERKKAVRLLECNYDALAEQRRKSISVRSFFGDLLIQTPDLELGEIDLSKAATEKKGSTSKLLDYRLGWIVCKHVKSNAIVIVKQGRSVGVGAGQMSRVDSARLAIDRARLHGHDPQGAVAASDAFLPFADTLEVLNDAGVVGLIQPGGSIRDREVIQIANERGMEMIFTGVRHFRH